MSQFNSNSSTAIENLDIAHTWTENLDISQSSPTAEDDKLAVG